MIDQVQQDAEFLTPTSKVFSVHQRLETSGARCAHVFTVGETLNLAVAQLATDVPGRPANMNNGNPDVEAILYRWEGGSFAERRDRKSGGEGRGGTGGVNLGGGR